MSYLYNLFAVDIAGLEHRLDQGPIVTLAEFGERFNLQKRTFDTLQKMIDANDITDAIGLVHQAIDGSIERVTKSSAYQLAQAALLDHAEAISELDLDWHAIETDFVDATATLLADSATRIGSTTAQTSANSVKALFKSGILGLLPSDWGVQGVITAETAQGLSDDLQRVANDLELDKIDYAELEGDEVTPKAVLASLYNTLPRVVTTDLALHLG